MNEIKEKSLNQQLVEEIQKITEQEKYNDLQIYVQIFNEDNGLVSNCGTMCFLCALEGLGKFVIMTNQTHKKHKDLEEKVN